PELVAYVLEGVAAVIAIEKLRLRIARLRVVKLYVVQNMPVGHEDVARPVVVVIDEERAEAAVPESGVAEFCRKRGVFESAGSQVSMVPRVSEVEVSDKNVRPAVPINIGGVRSHPRFGLAVFADGDAGQEGYFAEAAVMIVTEEEIRVGVIGDE